MTSPKRIFTLSALAAVIGLAFAFSRASSNAPASQQPSAAPTAEHGEQIFRRRCSGCHALDAEREGPRLRNVYGRNSATVSGFSYSTALKNAHIVWNDKTLDQWLTDPAAMVPGTDMDLRVPRADERHALIQYLQQVSAP